ncbi:hypothetical protein [Tunturiibacter gelidoferens]|uniref:Carbonic anhydrase n=1 Tax=Tunturiibacter gelidiferens TaxID=3069689 RepID=A0A9X0U888_9BACT|nr:hypothetical protein [Edaphobacter lichenicola]MBB5331822.1 carbonic anhydrase [Edaphobacter lichenicola]
MKPSSSVTLVAESPQSCSRNWVYSDESVRSSEGLLLAAASFHLIVLHHTHCSITRLAGDADKLAHYFQIPESEVKAKSVTDPYAAVAADVALLRAVPALPAKWLLSGLVYDVATGLVKTVVPPAPIRTS